MLPAYFLTLKQFRAGFEKKELNAQLLLMLLVVQLSLLYKLTTLTDNKKKNYMSEPSMLLSPAFVAAKFLIS